MTKLLLSVYEVDSANSSAGKSRADGWEMNGMMLDVSFTNKRRRYCSLVLNTPL